MTGWRLLIGAIGLLLTTPAAADDLSRWQPLIDQAAARCGVPSDWIGRVMHAESAGRTTLNGRPITSHAGAMGLMQLMPGTWGEMRTRLGLGPNPHDPSDNIIAGACYLRLMHDRFGYPGLFAAYNAGPGRYTQSLATGRSLPAETRAYLLAVGGAQIAAPAVANQVPDRSIFFALRASQTTEKAAVTTASAGPFVPLTGGTARD